MRASPALPAANRVAMSVTFRLLSFGAASLLAASLALAQGSGKTATLGAARPGGKLLSFDELSACLKQRDDLSRRRPQIEEQRAALERERAELQQIDGSLNAERAKVEQIEQTATDLAKRMKEQSQRIADFNERAAKLETDKPSGPSGDRQRRALERDKAALDKTAAELEAERAALGPQAEQLIKTYQSRVAQRNQAAEDLNARSATLNKTVAAHDTELADWKADCEGRPYREDDEKLIRSGK